MKKIKVGDRVRLKKIHKGYLPANLDVEFAWERCYIVSEVFFRPLIGSKTGNYVTLIKFKSYNTGASKANHFSHTKKTCEKCKYRFKCWTE